MNALYLIGARALVVFICLGLAACNDRAEEKQTLAPVAFHQSDECHVCGMVIADFPGPKGEVVAKARSRGSAPPQKCSGGGFSQRITSLRPNCMCTTWVKVLGRNPTTII